MGQLGLDISRLLFNFALAHQVSILSLAECLLHIEAPFPGASIKFAIRLIPPAE